MQNPGPLSQNLHLDKISRDANGHPGLRSPGLDPHVTSTGELGFFFLGSVKIKVKFTHAGVFSFFFPASLKQILDSPSLTPTDIIVSVSHSVVSDSFGTHGCSLPGSPIHGIQQARILDWVAIPFSREFS